MDVTFDYNGTNFVWNADKAQSNVGKHGISFEEAATTFFDPFFKLTDAERNDEARDAVIGYSLQERMLCVVHIEVEGQQIRLISARKADSKERNFYDDQ